MATSSILSVILATLCHIRRETRNSVWGERTEPPFSARMGFLGLVIIPWPLHSLRRSRKVSTHTYQVKEGQRSSLHLQGRPGGPFPREAGKVGWGCSSGKLFFLPFTCLFLVPNFTEQGQEEAGKGLKICGGSSLHTAPFRQKAAVHLMPMGEWPSPRPPLPLAAGEGTPFPFRLFLPLLASSPRKEAKGR